MLLLSPGVNAQVTCADLFRPPLIALKMLDQAVADLARLRIKIDLLQAQSSSAPQMKKLKGNYVVKENELARYFESRGILTREEFRARLRIQIQKFQNKTESNVSEEEEKRRNQKAEIESQLVTGDKIHFGHIEAGSFKMGQPGKEVTVDIGAFEIAKIPVTYFAWQMIAFVTAKQRMNGLGDSIAQRLEKLLGEIGAFAPVMNITHLGIEDWIEKLNRFSAENDPIIYRLVAGHKKGDRYRLPTNAEWEFVASDRGTKNVDMLPAPIDIGKSAWIRPNSGNKLQSVATKEPLRVSGVDIFDLFGNVWELTSTIDEVKTTPGLGKYYIARGCDYSGIPGDNTFVSFRERQSSGSMGFRLVRIRHDQ
jgi:formylglycine-generating enzyme required for sulfatase activity